jgi:hypothetical protein
MACKNLESAKLENKNNYDQKVFVPKFQVGTKVLVKDESVRRSADQRN